MISYLTIRDFAILKEIELPLHRGLTVITGETGSGKSLLLQALGVVLGGKGTKVMVRTGVKRAVLETEVRKVAYRRILSKAGRMKSYIDDEPHPEPQFREKVTSLVDFHGQHDQQLIMEVDQHIGYLDRFAGLSDKVEKIGETYDTLMSKRRELREAIRQRNRATERQELLEFQLQEIQALNPQPGEDEELETEFKTLNHIDEVIATVNRLNQIYLEDEQSLYNQLSESEHELERLVKIDDNLSEHLKSIRSAGVVIQDVADGLMEYVDTLDHNPQRLADVEERLQSIEGLKRKYGGTLEAVLLKQKDIRRELDNLSHLGSDIDRLNEEISDLEQEYQLLADQLHKGRVETAPGLTQAIVQEMNTLNMPEARFEIRINQERTEESFVQFEDQPVVAGKTGYDQVEFFLSANPGERLKPLKDIASGGEISRIMLAVKTVFQSIDPVHTLVFDEIDTGLSGSAAEKVAQALKTLAGDKQVICITHLPQIAREADRHLLVEKTISGDQTNVRVRYLSDNEREAARRELSGKTQTPDPEPSGISVESGNA